MTCMSPLMSSLPTWIVSQIKRLHFKSTFMTLSSILLAFAPTCIP